MNQEFPRSLLTSNDVALTRNSVATSISRPFARISTNSDQNRILIDLEPENSGSEDDDDDDGENDDSWARDCGYSRPLLFLDMIWNMSFVLVSIFVLLITVGERPSTPLRLWVFGYALQCLLHVGFVSDEYQSRRSLGDGFTFGYLGGGGSGQECCFPRVFLCSALSHNSAIKKLESINTIISSVWWVFGFYWIVIGGQTLLQDAPRLYWLSVVFLAFDVCFMVICISTACIVFLLLFCCFPILATVAYAMTIGDGASENDIRSLNKYLYRPQHTLSVYENEKKQVSLNALEDNSISMAELVLHPEDSECCICLFKYIDGAELCSLPCNHHFHHKCITKWLRINATCPLCKFNILRGDTLV